MIKGSLVLSITTVRQFLDENFQSHQMGPEIGIFGQ